MTAATVPDAASSTPPIGLEALPVLLDLGRGDAGRVVAWIEGVLGWQPVDTAAGGLPPRLRIADVEAVVTDDGGVPTLLLVAPDAPALVVARAVQRLRPEAVLAWPDARDDLVTTAADVLGAARPAATDDLTLRVGGAAGGVGTTTVTLALGALAAWRAGPALVVTAGSVPLACPRTVELDTLASPRTADDAPAVPGVPGLRVVHCAEHPVGAVVDAGHAEVVVRDVGTGADADVLVLRRDGAGIAGLERSAAAVAVVLDDGIAPLTAVTAAAGGRPTIVVPRSVRVARAGCLRRVPTALPASYLRLLRPLVPQEARRGR